MPFLINLPISQVSQRYLLAGYYRLQPSHPLSPARFYLLLTLHKTKCAFNLPAILSLFLLLLLSWWLVSFNYNFACEAPITFPTFIARAPLCQRQISCACVCMLYTYVARIAIHLSIDYTFSAILLLLLLLSNVSWL